MSQSSFSLFSSSYFTGKKRRKEKRQAEGLLAAACTYPSVDINQSSCTPASLPALSFYLTRLSSTFQVVFAMHPATNWHQK
jgi:hypothetical protein